MKYYNNSNDSMPEWVIQMYKENPDPGLVIRLYDDYYDHHEFIKINIHSFIKDGSDLLSDPNQEREKKIVIISNILKNQSPSK